MDVNILSNYMFGILVILLIIVIIVMYYLWNETKKNKNEISILHSDMSALRERLEHSAKKVEELESFESSQIPSKNVSKMSQQNILEHLMGNMGGFDISDFMRNGQDDEEESSEEEEESGEEEEESGEEEEESGEEEDESGEEEEESGEEEEGSGEEYVEEEGSGEEYVEEEGSGEEYVEEEKCEACEQIEEQEEEIKENVEDVKEVVFNEKMDFGKKPIQSASNFEEGYTERGMDKKMYVVALNKKGVKYWKVQK